MTTSVNLCVSPPRSARRRRRYDHGHALLPSLPPLRLPLLDLGRAARACVAHASEDAMTDDTPMDLTPEERARVETRHVVEALAQMPSEEELMALVQPIQAVAIHTLLLRRLRINGGGGIEWGGAGAMYMSDAQGLSNPGRRR